MLPVPALIPVETLPSWPAVNDPTVLEMLTLTLFIPLAIALVLALLILGPGWGAKDSSSGRTLDDRATSIDGRA